MARSRMTRRGTGRRRVGTALSVLLIVGQVVSFAIVLRPWETGDSGRYLDLADSIQQGGRFGLGSGPTYEPEGWRMPGYPLFIAACHALLGGGNAVVVAVQCLLYAASIVLIHAAARAAFGSVTAAVFLAGCALYPFVALYAAQLSTEMLSVFAVALAFFLMTSDRASRWAASGAILGLGALVRPNLLPMALIFALSSLFADIRSWRRAVLIPLAALAVVSPWAIRNVRVFGVLTPGPVIKGTGVVLLVSSWQSLVPIDDIYRYGMTGRTSDALKRTGMIDQVRSLNRAVGVPPDTVFVTPESYPGNATKLRADRLFLAAALANIRAHPVAYMRSVAWRIPRMWFTGRMPDGLPRLVKVVLVVEGILVLLLGVAGAVTALFDAGDIRARRIVGTAVLSTVYFALSMCWFHTEARYTIPVRLFLLMFAARAVAGTLPRSAPVGSSRGGGGPAAETGTSAPGATRAQSSPGA